MSKGNWPMMKPASSPGPTSGMKPVEPHAKSKGAMVKGSLVAPGVMKAVAKHQDSQKAPKSMFQKG